MFYFGIFGMVISIIAFAVVQIFMYIKRKEMNNREEK